MRIHGVVPHFQQGFIAREELTSAVDRAFRSRSITVIGEAGVGKSRQVWEALIARSEYFSDIFSINARSLAHVETELGALFRIQDEFFIHIGRVFSRYDHPVLLIDHIEDNGNAIHAWRDRLLEEVPQLLVITIGRRLEETPTQIEVGDLSLQQAEALYRLRNQHAFSKWASTALPDFPCRCARAIETLERHVPLEENAPLAQEVGLPDSGGSRLCLNETSIFVEDSLQQAAGFLALFRSLTDRVFATELKDLGFAHPEAVIELLLASGNAQRYYENGQRRILAPTWTQGIEKELRVRHAKVISNHVWKLSREIEQSGTNNTDEMLRYRRDLLVALECLLEEDDACQSATCYLIKGGCALAALLTYLGEARGIDMLERVLRRVLEADVSREQLLCLCLMQIRCAELMISVGRFEQSLDRLSDGCRIAFGIENEIERQICLGQLSLVSALLSERMSAGRWSRREALRVEQDVASYSASEPFGLRSARYHFVQASEYFRSAGKLRKVAQVDVAHAAFLQRLDAPLASHEYIERAFDHLPTCDPLFGEANFLRGRCFLAKGDFEAAIPVFTETLRSAESGHLLDLERRLHEALAEAYLLAGDAVRADEHLGPTIELTSMNGVNPNIYGLRGLLALEQGQFSQAERLIREAISEMSMRSSVVLDEYRLCSAFSAILVGDQRHACQMLDLFGESALEDFSDGSLRTLIKWLRGLLAGEGIGDAPVPLPERDSARLATLFRVAKRFEHGSRLVCVEVDVDGGWFRVAQGPLVELKRRSALRRILLMVARRQLSAPGSPSTNDELIHAGWPDQSIRPGAALNRLRVAIAELRRMGLSEYLCSDRRGYYFRSDIVLRFVRALNENEAQEVYRESKVS